MSWMPPLAWIIAGIVALLVGVLLAAAVRYIGTLGRPERKS